MKNEFKITCMVAAVLTASAFMFGCDPKTAPAEPEAKKETAAVEPQLKPTEMKVGETDAAAALDVKDPKVWAFLPDVVAEVNDKKITKSEFINFLATQIPGGKLPPMVTEDMLKTMVPNMIKSYVDKPLLLAAAAKAGFKPSKEAIVKELKSQIAKLPAQDLEAIKAQLAAQKKTVDSYIDEVASNEQAQESFAIENFLEKTIAAKIVVTDVQAKAFYNANPDMFKTPADPETSIRASHILIGSKKDDAPEKLAAARKKAEEILAQVQKNPAQFEELAKKESACPSGQNGGSLGAFGKGQMVPEFEQAAFALKEGQISGLVKTDFGYHIIRRDAAKKASVMPFEQVKNAIIAQLKNQEYSAALVKFVDGLEKAADVKIFVKAPVMPVPAAVPAPAAK